MGLIGHFTCSLTFYSSHVLLRKLSVINKVVKHLYFRAFNRHSRTEELTVSELVQHLSKGHVLDMWTLTDTRWLFNH